MRTNTRSARLPMSEPKAQRWRALIVFKDGQESLCILGGSDPQVKETYATAYLELMDVQQHYNVQQIRLEKWVGAPDRGQWVNCGDLNIPKVNIPQQAS